MEYSDSVQIKVVADDGAGGVTEAITPYLFSIGTTEESGVVLPIALLLSTLSLISISFVFKRKRK